MNINKAVDLSILNIKKEGLTDIFNRPFEIDLLNNPDFKLKIKNEILNCLNDLKLSSLQINNLSHILLPKHSVFSFRKCALMQPMDTLKYSTLAIALADVIEKARIPVAKKRIFSYRFKPSPDDYLFNDLYSITTFREEASKRAKSKEVKYIISCDIANFYDRLNLHRLENSLLSINCDEKIVKLINELLLFWSGRDSYGLPVGSNASRILAEASLIGIDNYLMSMNIDFIRFVDDYRIFAKDAKTAHYWMTILIERLQKEGLFINTSKTKIEECLEYCIETKEANEIKNNVVFIDTNTQAANSLSDNVIDTNIKNTDEITNTNRNVIRAGYGGTVPTKFRALSNREIENLNNEDIESLVNSLKSATLIQPVDFIKTIRVCVAKKQFDSLIDLYPLLDNFLQLTPYYVDALIKNSNNLSNESKQGVIGNFTNSLLDNKYKPEYLLLAYITILGHAELSNKEALMEYFRNQKRNDGVYVGRVLLDSINNIVTKGVDREIALEIRDFYNRADYWEKRQIAQIVKKVLYEEEARPWLKNISIIETNDLFLKEIAQPTKKKKNSCKKV